jgi:hypothetical protein
MRDRCKFTVDVAADGDGLVSRAAPACWLRSLIVLGQYASFRVRWPGCVSVVAAMGRAE